MTKALTKAKNPFGAVKAEQKAGGAMAAVEQSRAIAEAQAAIAIAKSFPRDQVQAMDRILNACTRPSLAERASYQYKRGGTDITGPTIRLAEAIAQNWGNMQFGIRELEQGDGFSTMEAFAWDLETNVRETRTFHVRHWRDTKSGGYKLKDARDIYEMTANMGARRLRACILSIIPRDVVDTAEEQCATTLAASADTSATAIAKMVEKFEKFGVDKKQIEGRIQRRIESITPAQVIGLRRVYNSLKDGMSEPSDWFDTPKPETPPEPPSEPEAPANVSPEMMLFLAKNSENPDLMAVVLKGLSMVEPKTDLDAERAVKDFNARKKKEGMANG